MPNSWFRVRSSANRALRALAPMVVVAVGAALCSGAGVVAAAAAPPIPAPRDAAWPGTLQLDIDLSDLERRVFQVRETIPVAPGALVLQYPRWLPGNHAPTGSPELLAGLVIEGLGAAPAPGAQAARRRIEWRRDELDMYSFRLDVPAGVRTLELRFQFVTPVSSDQGRRTVTPDLLGLQWEKALLYPAGHYVRRILVQPSIRLPAGFEFASALEGAQRDGDVVRFATVPLEMLVDSPLFAGRHHRRFELTTGSEAPARLNVFADRPAQLEAKPAQVEAHRRLVREAGALFGIRHYRHYDFLLALSAQFDGIGLEHLQSSENGVGGDYFTEWDTARSDRDLLAHEFVHSWNGKFRRPADLWTPTYNVPMRNSLLWVYEGMTEYWGMVLAARSGLWPESYAREAFAHVAATFGELRAGRAWRALGDTTQQPIMAYHQPLAYPAWQRSTDYYQEGALLWLDVDARLREASGERRSLDDFAARFAGGTEGDAGPSTYTFDDVVAALAALAPADWSKLLRARIDGHGGGDAEPLAGFARTGWKLVYGGEPNEYVRDLEKLRKTIDHSYSIGLVLGRDDGRVIQAVWDGPAFRAGVATGATVVAVDGRQFSADVLKEALQAAATPGAREPIELLVKRGDRYQVLKVDWHGGLRYPHLVRIDGAPDRLGALLRPRTGEPPAAVPVNAAPPATSTAAAALTAPQAPAR